MPPVPALNLYPVRSNITDLTLLFGRMLFTNPPSTIAGKGVTYGPIGNGVASATSNGFSGIVAAIGNSQRATPHAGYHVARAAQLGAAPARSAVFRVVGSAGNNGASDASVEVTTMLAVSLQKHGGDLK